VIFMRLQRSVTSALIRPNRVDWKKLQSQSPDVEAVEKRTGLRSDVLHQSKPCIPSKDMVNVKPTSRQRHRIPRIQSAISLSMGVKRRMSETPSIDVVRSSFCIPTNPRINDQHIPKLKMSAKKDQCKTYIYVLLRATASFT
jgi:hypothetical protein